MKNVTLFNLMSFVTLLLIKEGYVYVINCHYRTAQKIINNPHACLALFKRKYVLDAGYLIVDFDQKQVFSRQNAFSVTKVLPKMDVYEL